MHDIQSERPSSPAAEGGSILVVRLRQNGEVAGAKRRSEGASAFGKGPRGEPGVQRLPFERS